MIDLIKLNIDIEKVWKCLQRKRQRIKMHHQKILKFK